MDERARLLDAVAAARSRYLDAVGGLSPAQAAFTPTPERWSVLALTEHLVLAEQAGVNGLWRALDGYRAGTVIWTGKPIHRALTIEEVIERTWQPKEQVPEIAAPRWGGTLAFWAASLQAQQAVLAALADALAGVPLEAIIYPHPISGPLDARQRLEFLRFHLDRHRAQVEAIKTEAAFPAR